MTRIFLLLNDPLIAARMRAVIDASPGLTTAGWVTSLDQARVQLAQARPDLVLADLQLADGPFASLLDALRESGRYGRPKAMLLAASPDEPHLLAALRHGADGYALHTRSAEALLEVIQQVLRGEAEMAPAIAQRVKDHFDAPASKAAGGNLEASDAFGLDVLERRVLDALAAGHSPLDVCRALFITSRDLGLRVRSIYRKLQLDLRAGTLTLMAA